MLEQNKRWFTFGERWKLTIDLISVNYTEFLAISILKKSEKNVFKIFSPYKSI